MNQCFIIGNLTHEPEMKKTTTDVPVCTFTVAVNRRKRGDNEQAEADFFRVTAWRNIGENCAKYLHKGKKVSISGPVYARAYMGKDGQAHASLEITAQDVEFLSPPDSAKHSTSENDTISPTASGNDAMPVITDEELPF